MISCKLVLEEGAEKEPGAKPYVMYFLHVQALKQNIL